MINQESIIGFVVGILLAGGGSLLLNLVTGGNARTRAKAILDNADRDVENKLKDAEVAIKERELERRAEFEEKQNQAREEVHQRERALDKRENLMNQQTDDLKKQETFIQTSLPRQNRTSPTSLKRNENNSTKSLGFPKKKRPNVCSNYWKTIWPMRSAAAFCILEHERRIKETCEEKSREMLMMATQRMASSQVSDSTTSTVDIPSDEMKGRIIGREGRNIRAFEKETGIDVIIDDTPGVVIVSGFDPVRREVARIALDRLITDGRIHPSRIEEVVAETQKEIDALIVKKGREAVQEVGVNGVNKRVIAMLGRLHFRTSYSQNVLRHSIEVAFLSGMLAEMMGFDPDIAQRAGLFHDIGKAADHDQEGGHPKIGAEFLKRNGESEEVVHAAYGHHDEILVPGVSHWTDILNVWKSWRRSPRNLAASGQLSPSKPVERFV